MTIQALPRPLDERQDSEYRAAPHNIEAEQALLGAILVNNEAFYRVSDFLAPEHFFESVHQRIFDVISQLIRGNKTATPVTLKTFLERDEPIGEIPVTQYLARLAAAATTVINAEDYGRTIYELATRRRLISIGEDMVNLAYDAPVDMPPAQQIAQTEQRLFELAETGKYGSGFLRFAEALKDAIDMASKAYQRDGHLSGISSGLRDLDETLGGLQPSDLVILAGRPAMGKTALATNIAFHIAARYKAQTLPDGRVEALDGGIVGFFSLEMSPEQLATRIISEQAAVASETIRRGKTTREEFDRLVDVATQLQSIPFYIDATGGLSIAQLAARARRLKRQKGLDMLVIDYLQLLQGSSRRSQDSRVQEITEITTGLKALAKELNVPILALSQLSRQVEAREDKRPQLADLRESGSIEQDADVVMFVYREEYYLKGKKPREGTPEFETWQDEMALAHGLAEVIIAKQRHGPTGTVNLSFQAEFTRFENLASDARLPERIE
ncbi:replicative DNA helicase [Microbaculum marinisediminis]|uniref:Replicative DNA helicase n=1 Tax=Microbaculum marinisediminis TaxID=2931392 RepID=A0AAW5QZR6_9HYPH|nr:replicative DNA helicase [Microbaculum sp. A6E488]MCT8973203.1 replicative DNA helicase [Microbaculum sp. A6E488]